MGALASNRNKRNADFQPYPSTHNAKRYKSSPYPTKIAKTLISRIGLYPKPVTPINREIHAPCRVVTGFRKRFSPTLKKSDFSGNSCVENTLLYKYNHAKEAAVSTCKNVEFEKEKNVVEVIDLDDDDGIVEDGGIDSGSSSIEVVEVMDDEVGDVDVSVERVGTDVWEVEEIKAKYRELDRVSSDIMDVNVDCDVGLPLHQKLFNESVERRDTSLRGLKFKIKLEESKLASLRELRLAKKKEDAANAPFKALTDEELEMVENALSYSNRKRELITHENSCITITGEILHCLKPRAWLNDEVINLYFELLKERETREPKKFLKCHFFNTFFYKKLISGRNGYDYNSVRRWTTQKKLGYGLLDCDKIFVPIHKEVHWCLAVINKKERKFQYLDSLGGADRKVMRILAKYITDEVKDKTGRSIDVTSWEQEFVTDLPTQENGYDCGMFMIKYADFYSRDIGLCFNQEDMTYFRLRTAKEILTLRAN